VIWNLEFGSTANTEMVVVKEVSSVAKDYSKSEAPTLKEKWNPFPKKFKENDKLSPAAKSPKLKQFHHVKDERLFMDPIQTEDAPYHRHAVKSPIFEGLHHAFAHSSTHRGSK
jgi:hypothetical protein